MRYSRLITSLIDECIAASLGGYDVEDAIGHLDSGGDLIRATLIKAFCDPRVKSTVRPAKWWEDAAQDKFEELALKLMQTDGLTPEQAERMMDGMLSRYFFTMIQRVSSPDLGGAIGNGEHMGINGGSGDGEDGEDGDEEKAESITDALDDIETGLTGESDGEDEDDEDDEPGSGPGRGTGIPSTQEEREIELNFMRKIPKSLVRLAKLIGRAGSSDLIPSGHFLSAAKSDIAGITVGDDLSNLLPSEVALLACPATQDIFLKNFAEKRLQVFASASSGGADSIIHQDGPVIICLDTSGSMIGRPAHIAAALTMAVTIVAQRQHREVLIVKYSSGQDLFTLKNLRRQRKELMSFLSHYDGNGNNEEDMFKWLFNEVLPQQREFTTADVLCISDFGWVPVSAETYAKINDYKSKGMIFYGLDTDGIGLHDFTLPDYIARGEGSVLPPDIIDSMWLWLDSKGKCIEEEKNRKKKNG